MSNAFWYLSRATGIIGTVLLVAALAFGFLFSGRDTGSWRRPAWWLDLHNWLGGLALTFIAAHIASAYLDRDQALEIASIFIPGVATANRLALAWGVIATYLVATAVFTSWPRRHLPRRVWRAVHLGSVGGTVLVVVHGYQMGTDSTNEILEIVALLLIAIGFYTLAIRLIGLVLDHGLHARREIHS